VKAYWVAVGLGILIAVAGGLVYVLSDHRLGVFVILGGMVVAIIGLVMRLIQWAVDNSK